MGVERLEHCWSERVSGQRGMGAGYPWWELWETGSLDIVIVEGVMFAVCVFFPEIICVLGFFAGFFHILEHTPKLLKVQFCVFAPTDVMFAEEILYSLESYGKILIIEDQNDALGKKLTASLGCYWMVRSTNLSLYQRPMASKVLFIPKCLKIFFLCTIVECTTSEAIILYNVTPP